MKELINDIKKDIEKCKKSLSKNKISELDKRYLSGMIDSYNRVIFNIEINYLNKK